MLRYGFIRTALHALALTRFATWKPASDSAGLIVTLHHVRPSRRAAFDPNALLSITPDFLDRFLAHFRAAGWHFVPVEDLVAGSAGAGDPRRIAVTLDDGFRDNADYAWPVFKRHAVPFTIFVCPGFCDRTAELWWEALERIISKAEILSLDGEGPVASLQIRTPSEKRRAFHRWRTWLTSEADEARQRWAIRKLALKYGVDLSELARELIMDWDEVRAIAADPLCSIGAHTMTHPSLGRLPAEQALREMVDSADRIEAEIGTRPGLLAFPYGYRAAAGAREAELASQAGFRASFTTRPGYIRHAQGPHGLPRVSINGLFQDVRYLEALLAPRLWQIRDSIGQEVEVRSGRVFASRKPTARRE